MRIRLMCPKCGLLKRVEPDDHSCDICENCQTKTIQIEIGEEMEADFGRADENEMLTLRERVWRKFLYNNPHFNEETFERRINHEKAFREEIRQYVAKLPKCPTCQSTDIAPISGLERGASVLTLGLFSKKINKSFKCNKCGYTW